MKTTTIRFVAGMLVIICFSVGSSRAQTIAASVKPQADSPLLLQSGQCAKSAVRGYSCFASGSVASGQWSAYGVVWKLTYADGKILTHRTTTDVLYANAPESRTLGPGSSISIATGGVFLLDSSGKEVPLTSAEVAMDFCIPANTSTDKVWGNTKSQSYLQVIMIRDGYAKALASMRSAYAQQGVSGVLAALGVQH
jgi:hypothetical protein